MKKGQPPWNLLNATSIFYSGKKLFDFFKYKENCGSFKNFQSIDRLTVKKNIYD